MRARIIDPWMELEAKVSAPVSLSRAPECGLRYIGAAEARNIEPGVEPGLRAGVTGRGYGPGLRGHDTHWMICAVS
jgi:hypothetical protein